MLRLFRCRTTAPDPDPAARDLDSVLRVILYGLGINSVFFLQDPFGKALCGILIENRNHGLDDNWTRIDPFVRKMNGAP